jgi:regulator of cell morphogenesis and NO signaling
MINFTEKETLGYIVTKFPGAAIFFMSHQMDYGYQGDESLEDAVEHANLNLEQILLALNMLYHDFIQFPRPFVDWSLEPMDHLIDYISKKHLTALREEMNHLEDTMVDHIHHFNKVAQILENIHGHLIPLTHSLKKHLAKEEAVFFAVLAYYQETNHIETLRDLHGIIDDLDGEHETLTEQVFSLHNTLKDAIDYVADNEPILALITKLKHFTHMITEHIHLENNLLFKQI